MNYCIDRHVGSLLLTFPLKFRLLKIINTRQTLANKDPKTRVKPKVSRYVQLWNINVRSIAMLGNES